MSHMSETPENQVLPEPSENPSPDANSTQPPEQHVVEESAHPAEEGDTALSELRQSLAEEESGKAGKPGGLVQRITETLRRGTGPLRKQSGPLKGETPSQPSGHPAQQEMGDEFLSGRLGGATAEPPEARVTDFQSPGGQAPSGAPAVPGQEAGDEYLQGEGLDLFADEEDQSAEPDWMAAIRQEAAEEEIPPIPPVEPAPSVEQPPLEKPASSTGPLRSFITGLFRGEERRGKPGAEEIPDEFVSDRLDRSTSVAPEPGKPGEGQPGAATLGELPGEIAPTEETGAELPPWGQTSGETPGGEGLSLGDEELLWGDAAPSTASTFEGPTLTPEDVWGGVEAPAPGEEAPGRGAPDNTFSSIFLTGEELIQPEAPVYPQDQLLREALEKSSDKEPPVSVEEIRAIALEDYTEPEEDRRGYAPVRESATVLTPEGAAAAVEAEAEPELAETGPLSFRQWLAARTTTEKILLVEVAVVLVVLLLAVPFYILTITHGPVAKVGYLIPRPLPADLPYPTAVDLPGGWNFSLQKSTFVGGQWKPAASEWLEGTELRRIVAIPWNPQTEAVVRTFKPGDTIWLTLSNADRFSYTVTQVERVSITDTQILSDRSPSLVIILYQENAKERWVVFCKP